MDIMSANYQMAYHQMITIAKAGFYGIAIRLCQVHGLMIPRLENFQKHPRCTYAGRVPQFWDGRDLA